MSQRPNDKILYAPLKHQFDKLRQERQAELERRRAASSVRPEKKDGLRK